MLYRIPLLRKVNPWYRGPLLEITLLIDILYNTEYQLPNDESARPHPRHHRDFEKGSTHEFIVRLREIIRSPVRNNFPISPRLLQDIRNQLRKGDRDVFGERGGGDVKFRGDFRRI